MFLDSAETQPDALATKTASKRPPRNYPATCTRSRRLRNRRVRPEATSCRTRSIKCGCRAAMCSSTNAGPSGVRRFASQACTSFVLTFRYCANTACEACKAARTRLTARPFSDFGGSGSVVVRRLRLPCACSRASFADPRSSVNVSSFIAVHSLGASVALICVTTARSIFFWSAVSVLASFLP
jgi:hypothetical protein